MINITELIRAFFLNTQTEDYITIYKSGRATFDYAKYFASENGSKRLDRLAKSITHNEPS